MKFLFLDNVETQQRIAKMARNSKRSASVTERPRKFSTVLRSKKSCAGSSLIMEPTQNTIKLLVPKI